MINNIPKKELIQILRGKLSDEQNLMSYNRRIEVSTRLNILEAENLKEMHLTQFITDKMVNQFIHWCQPTSNIQIVNSIKLIFNIVQDPFHSDRGGFNSLNPEHKNSLDSNLNFKMDTLDHLKIKNLNNCHCQIYVGHSQVNNKKFNIPPNPDNVTIKCTNSDCNKGFHYSCMKWPGDQQKDFECPQCIIKHNDPQNQPIRILHDPSLLVSDHTYTFSINFDDFNKIFDSSLVGIEIRSLKLDNEHFYEQTWPDKCTIKINNRVAKILKPLNQNSSLKKRRDEKLFTRNYIYPGINTLNISYENYLDNKNSKENQDSKYVFTILLVRKLKAEKLRDIVVNQRKISYEFGKQFIKDRFKTQQDIPIAEIKADLICKITYSQIDTPARGIHCKHINCFSLLAFIKSMEQNMIRKWTCPLCRKRCPTLLYDEYMGNVLNEAKRMANKIDVEPQYAYFDKEGQFSFQSRRTKTKEPSANQSVQSYQASINKSVTQNVLPFLKNTQNVSTEKSVVALQSDKPILNLAIEESAVNNRTYPGLVTNKKAEICDIEDDEVHNIEVIFLAKNIRKVLL